MGGAATPLVGGDGNVPAFRVLSLLDLGESVVETAHFFGCNLFVSKQAVFDLGGFNPDGMPEPLLKYRGDGETGLWLKSRAVGMRLLYDPVALAYHVVPARRMTVDYLRGRAYRQGISASFTDLHGNPQDFIGVAARRRHPGDSRAWIRRQWPVGVVRFCRCYLKSTTNTERKIAMIELKLGRSFALGWAFHRSAFRRDPAVRAHVLRRSFISDRECTKA